MKKIKILVLLVAVSVATFYSCTDNNPIEDEAVTQNSIAMRTAMNELKIANNISDRHSANSTTANPFCFTFVYPITLSYNTGTIVTVTSLDGLLDILANETPNLYVDGISFPFQVMQNGAISTIGTEGQYIALLTGCGFNTINTDLLNSLCFDIVFPITLINPSNQIVAIGSQGEFVSYLSNPSVGQSQISYPISVNYQNQIVVIDNIYELYQMINNCDDCICTLQYDPVCVQTATGVVEFGNLCFAQCAGFTQNDLVPCSPSTTCSITNITAVAGACNVGTTTFPLTINFSYSNAPGSTFEVRNANNVLLGTYPLSSLPLTIPNFTDSSPGGSPIDTIQINLGTSCSQARDFMVSDCTDCACPTNVDPVCVQTPTGTIQYSNSCVAICAGHSPNSFVTCPTATFGSGLGSCFTMAYPVQVMSGGQVITLDTNGALLQYYFPSSSPIPAFVYPVTATFGSMTVTITSQAGFQSFIQANCN